MTGIIRSFHFQVLSNIDNGAKLCESFKAQALARLALLEITFLKFNLIFLSPDFRELWHSMMSTCLVTEVKQQWATLVLGWVTASVHHSCL